jgi:hypothetical protein
VYRSNGWKEPQHRLPYLAMGVITGLALWGLNSYLLVRHVAPVDAAFRQIGDHSLIDSAAAAPSALGFVMFSTGLLTLMKWIKQTTPIRKHRFSLWTVLITMLASWILAHIFAFPGFLAVAWGAMTSVTVQVCSPWFERPVKRRA